MSTMHPASDKKRRRLRAQGDVAPVRDLLPAGLMLGTGLVLWGIAPRLVAGLAQLFQRLLSDPTPHGLGTAIPLLRELALWTGAGAGLLVLGSILPAWWASGWLWAPARLRPSLFPGLQPGLARPVRDLVILLVALLGLQGLRSAGEGLASASQPQQMALQAARWLRGCTWLGGGLVILGGILLHVLARRSYEDRIQMTDAERRQEAKEDQPSPAVREFQQELAGDLLRGPVPPSTGGGSAGMTVMEKPGGGNT